jgi:hypothetical protein
VARWIATRCPSTMSLISGNVSSRGVKKSFWPSSVQA